MRCWAQESVAAVCQYLFPYIDYFDGHCKLEKEETCAGDTIIHNTEINE
jgi:hypothetical protein